VKQKLIIPRRFFDYPLLVVIGLFTNYFKTLNVEVVRSLLESLRTLTAVDIASKLKLLLLVTSLP